MHLADQDVHRAVLAALHVVPEAELVAARIEQRALDGLVSRARLRRLAVRDDLVEDGIQRAAELARRRVLGVVLRGARPLDESPDPVDRLLGRVAAAAGLGNDPIDGHPAPVGRLGGRRCLHGCFLCGLRLLAPQHVEQCHCNHLRDPDCPGWAT